LHLLSTKFWNISHFGLDRQTSIFFTFFHIFVSEKKWFFYFRLISRRNFNLTFQSTCFRYHRVRCCFKLLSDLFSSSSSSHTFKLTSTFGEKKMFAKLPIIIRIWKVQVFKLKSYNFSNLTVSNYVSLVLILLYGKMLCFWTETSKNH